MAQIIVVIGKRKSGKTTACDYVHAFDPTFKVVNMNMALVAAFSDLHETTTEEVMRLAHREINRDFMYLYSEYKRRKDKNVFLNPVLEYIHRLDKCMVDNVMYFNELEALMKMQAEIIYIDADTPIRQTRGLNPHMDLNPSELEVSDISPQIVKAWGGFVIDNNKELMSLKTALGDTIHQIWRKTINKK